MKISVLSFIVALIASLIGNTVVVDALMCRQDKIEVLYTNKDYYENVKMAIHNSTNDVRMLNASFNLKQDLPDVVMMHVQVYKKTSSEYKMFPLNMTADICPYLAKESPDTKTFSEHTNMRKCPIKKGHYHVSNMVLEDRKVAPYIPAGLFMVESTTYIYKDTNLLITRAYATVS